MKDKIPFSKPYLDHRALDYIRSALESGKLSGDGPVSKAVEARLRSAFGMKHALLTTSGSHALEMSMMLLDLQPGDEVITPSFTFVSTANAIIRGGGKPVFCEINDRTCTLDPADVERRISPRTRAVVAVHYAGVAAEMDEIAEIARARSLAVIEDAAQGVNATYRGKFLGTLGDTAAYSFHDTKNYVSGEGGAFITDDESLARRAEIVREKGTNRSVFLRGEVDKYTWVEHGSSYVLSEILASILQYQLGMLDTIQDARRRIHECYVEGLQELERQEKLRLPVIPPHCGSNFHIFYVLLRNEQERIRVSRELREEGISATFHYVPLHSSPYARRSLGTGGLTLPVTDSVFERLLRLPIYPGLEPAQTHRVIESLRKILR